jgi:hypothetical protein
LIGALGEQAKRFEQLRHGGEPELGPDPAAPLAVLGFQIPDAAAGLGVGFAGQCLETSEHLGFAGGVVGGPAGEVLAADGQAHLLGLDPAQQFGDTREGGGVFCKALPDLVPTALPLVKPFGSGELTVFGRIELELFFPGGGKDCPLFLAAALLEGLVDPPSTARGRGSHQEPSRR